MWDLTITLAQRYGLSLQQFMSDISKNVFPGFNEADVRHALVLCNEYKLNPFTRQIFLLKTKHGVAPYVSIDGWIKIAQDTGKLNGQHVEVETDENGKPYAAHFTGFHKDMEHPIRITELYSECWRDNSEPWRTMPNRMLRWKAMIQGYRVMFGLSGIYDEDEARDIVRADFIEVEPEEKGTEAVKKRAKARKTKEEKPADATEQQKKQLWVCANESVDMEEDAYGLLHFMLKIATGGKDSMKVITKSEASRLIDWFNDEPALAGALKDYQEVKPKAAE